MDVVPAESQFAAKVVVTWLLLFVGYGVYLNISQGEASGSFETVDEDADGMTSVESTSGGEVTSDDGENDAAEPPAFSPEGLVHWLYGRTTRRELLAAANPDAFPEEYENTNSMLHLMRTLQMLLMALQANL